MSKHNDNTDGSLKGRPECIDPACAGAKGEESPFKTYDMNQNSDNCSYTNCQQWVKFGPTIGTENVNMAEMEMNCGNTDYIDPASKETQVINRNDDPVLSGSSGAPVTSSSSGAPVISVEEGITNSIRYSNTTKGIITLLLFIVFLFFLFIGLPLLQDSSIEDQQLNQYDDVHK
jgi:hypothetical protein